MEWFKFLESLKEEVKSNWADGLYVGANGEETLQRNAAAVGQADLLSRLLEATFVEIVESNYDNK